MEHQSAWRIVMLVAALDAMEMLDKVLNLTDVFVYMQKSQPY